LTLFRDTQVAWQRSRDCEYVLNNLSERTRTKGTAAPLKSFHWISWIARIFNALGRAGQFKQRSKLVTMARRSYPSATGDHRR
jgi:hypothetical protein